MVSLETSGQSAAVTSDHGATVVSLRTPMPVTAEALFAWHERPGAFERLTPGFMPARVIERSGGIRDGATVVLAVPVGPTHTTWRLEHTRYVAGREFRDVQRAGPFAAWEHVHRTEPAADGTSVLDDAITYRLPLPPFGALVADAYTREKLERLLRWRHALTRLDLERHLTYAARGARRVAITGASGFLGGALVPFLTTGGHLVRTIGRGAGSDARWDPAASRLDAGALDGVDAVIHLAGSSVAERWTAATKREILASRLQGTRLIAEQCARATVKPEVLVCASAVGIYGSRGDEKLDEQSAPGDDFLADVGRQWEAAAAPARDAGIRVVHLRTGIVLNPAGGALAKMITPMLLGAGGRLGGGTQWMSWISREDWVGAVHHALQTPGLSGALNLTAPEPVTNRTFTESLGRILHRPTIAAVPAFVLRTLFGEMASGTILASQRAHPAALQRSGFEFAHPTLASALRFELGLL